MSAKVSKAYNYSPVQQIPWAKVCLFTMLVVFGIVITKRFTAGSSSSVQYLRSMSKEKYVKAITWNIAAVNNNPFEYWITNDDPKYNEVMKKVSSFIDKPDDTQDVEVQKVFTDGMYTELETSMKGVGWTGLEETRAMWESDFKKRKIITQFIKDGLLGKKRLASMPDRVTNTINTADQSVILRPTVINCYSGDLSSTEAWWKQWQQFVFSTPFNMSKEGKVSSVKVHQLFNKIKKSKYPSITAEEEQISIPLQTLSLAIFDSILVHMMNTIDRAAWQALRNDICTKLNRKKSDRTVEILHDTYGDADIQFLQEVAGNFPAFVKDKPLARLFDVYGSASMDADRDQNSFILLRKGRYRDVTEVTADVVAEFAKQKAKDGSALKVPVTNGDLIALLAIDKVDNTKYLLASFHGDTNGLATIPVVTAMHSYATSRQPDCKMIFGMDANTYAKPEEDQQGVTDFAAFYTAKKLNSCYGPTPNPLNFTTFHARTHLQPQLNKAVTLEEKGVKGDKNPKDFIVFFAADFAVEETKKDNTGTLKYVEDMVFPTLAFPSDHGITSTILREVKADSTSATAAAGAAK